MSSCRTRAAPAGSVAASAAREYGVEGETMLQIRSDRNTVAPYGLFGGRRGGLGHNILNPGPRQRIIHSKATVCLQSGYRSERAGGGGWGCPLDRDPERIWQDVLDEKITREFAELEHVVVIGERGPDLAGTKRLREALRAQERT